MSELKRLMLKQLSAVKHHYEGVAPRMMGLPLSHPELDIQIVIQGWCPFETDGGLQGRGLLAGVITPWCLNALLLPLVWPLEWSKRTGAEVEVLLPADRFVMLVNEGGFLTLSLLAEPRQLADQQAAEIFMREALALLRTTAEAEVSEPVEVSPGARLQSALDTPVSRRGILGGA
jgi:hypothetical protein